MASVGHHLNGFKEIVIQGQQENPDGVFPLALSFSSETISIDETKKLLKDNKAELLRLLGVHGVLFFRGFPLKEAADFADFLEPFDFEYGDYLGGGGPRTSVHGPIHTSTETPADSIIPFHHELAYLTKHPSKLSFFCHTPTEKDGETPILLSNRVYENLKKELPEFVEKVERLKIRYSRIIACRDKCDRKYQRGWEDAFLTEDRKVAEVRAKEVGTETVQWMDDNAMKVMSAPLEATRVDPRNNKKVWFNSVVLLHPAAQDRSKVVNPPWMVYYGDGTPVEDEYVIKAKAIMNANGVALHWERGDVMLVDNFLALHARNSFVPPRLILAAIINN